MSTLSFLLTPLPLAVAFSVLLQPAQSLAQNQTVPGQGNDQAIKIAEASPFVNSAYKFLVRQSSLLSDRNLRDQTRDALSNPNTCILHRANLKPADKQKIVSELLAHGFLNPADDATFPGGLLTGVFPPVLNDSSACPHLPQQFWSAPGSTFDGHHSYPGGLAVHEANNETAAINLAAQYANIYGSTNSAGLPAVNSAGISLPHSDSPSSSALSLNRDLIVGPPLWHDWAKILVFQWNADGTEFRQLNIGGKGAGLDNNGAAGDSRTGSHHILSIAEAMSRGFSPAFILTQASAHSSPTNGNEFKVVNWIRAAAIIARLDPVARGYLTTDKKGNLRLPALLRTGEVNLVAAGQGNFLIEYELHTLSDADFNLSEPAIAADELILAQLAPAFGYDHSKATIYNTKYRNVIFSNFSAERLYAIYTASGVNGVREQIQKLRVAGKL